MPVHFAPKGNRGQEEGLASTRGGLNHQAKVAAVEDCRGDLSVHAPLISVTNFPEAIVRHAASAHLLFPLLEQRT